MSSVDNYFLGAFAQTIKQNSTSPHLVQFANHLLINKLQSKQWLVDELLQHVTPRNVLILGSWYPTYIPYCLNADHYTCVDVDPTVEVLSREFNNKLYKSNKKFTFKTEDAKLWLVRDHNEFDVVINTSCEHMDFDLKDMNLNDQTVYALQSNNYQIDQHVNYKESLDQFIQDCGLSTLLYTGQLKLDKYTRFMVIGKL